MTIEERIKELKNQLENRLREIDWENPEKNIADLRGYIEWLAMRFEGYQICPPLGWRKYIYYWLTQFENIEEVLTAMKIISNIIFIDNDLYEELQKITYQELKDYVHYVMGMDKEDFLNEILFFPIDGSGEVHLINFIRINKIKGRKDRIRGRLYVDEPDILLEPIKLMEKLQNLKKDLLKLDMKETDKEFLEMIFYSYELNLKKRIEEMKKKYKSRKYLCIVTDFVGSGDTIGRDIKRIKEYYTNFEKIFVISYVGTECGLRKIREIGGDKIEAIICGLEIPNHLKIFDNNNLYFTDEEKKEIMQMCNKYFPRFSHPDIKMFGKEIRYGYKGDEHACGNGQLVCLYTNCPNNSIPLLWAGSYELSHESDKWSPLFERVPPYVYHATGGGKI